MAMLFKNLTLLFRFDFSEETSVSRTENKVKPSKRRGKPRKRLNKRRRNKIKMDSVANFVPSTLSDISDSSKISAL